MGTRPADELVLLEHVNLLCEEKRTDGDRFMLSMLRTDQLKGLINFEKALDRNIGLVLVSFLNEAVDVIRHNRLPLIVDVFIKGAHNPHKGKATHG